MDQYSFTPRELRILDQVAIQVDEVYIEDRKGIAQTRYIMRVDEGATWNDWDSDMCADEIVSSSLVGHWMTAFPDNLTYRDMAECLKDLHWVKCEPKEVITIEWVSL